MSTLTKFDSFNKKVSLTLEGIGLAAMIIMVFITTVDVIGAKILLKPIFGALDAVMLLQLTAIAFAGSITLITGRHIEVEFLTNLFPKTLQHIVDFIVKILCFALFVALAWYMLVYAHHLQVRMETTPTARISLYPFAYGAAIALFQVCLSYLALIIKCFQRMINHES